MKQREAIWDSTRRAHNRINNSTLYLCELADAVDYMHPNLAKDLRNIADSINESNIQIKGNAAELTNIDIADMQRSMGETLSVLLNRG